MGKSLDFNKQELVIGAIQGRLKQSLKPEELKGCDSKIYSYPVDIEPLFQPYLLSNFLRLNSNPNTNLTPKPQETLPEKVFLRLWFSTNDEFSWQNFDIILKELSIIKNPISLLLIGNSERITCELGVVREDEIPLRHTLTSKFTNIQIDTNLESCFLHFLQKNSKSSSKEYTLDMRDFVAPPAYWRNSINYDALRDSPTPLLPVYSLLSSLPKEEFAFYQIIFKAATKPWKENILSLIEGDFESSPYATIRQHLFPKPSVGLEDFKEAKKKLIGPYFATSLRVGICCKPETVKGGLDSLSLVVSGVQYCDRQFSYLTKADYLKVVKESELVEMIASAVVRRQGALLTAQELCALFNFGSKEIVRQDKYPLDKAVGFKATEQFLEEDGVVLGTSSFAGKQVLIRQPERLRPLHTSIIGLIGKGKTYFMESMILSDIERGAGVGVIDSSGDLVPRILPCIPQHRAKDVQYISLCEKDHVLAYNFLELSPGQDIGKKVDDLLVSIRALFPGNAWGPSTESAIFILLWTLIRGKRPLTDATTLFSKSEEGYQLREKLLPLIDNPEVLRYWEDVFERMPATAIHRVLNKLTMFLLPEITRRIFSQEVSKLDFRATIDERKIFLEKIPAGIIGSDCANFAGSISIAAFKNAGLSRADIPPHQRIPFNLYIDEFHRFRVKSLADCLRELRKYEVRLILACQQRESLEESIRNALGNVGTQIVLGVDWREANLVHKELYSQVEENKLMRLPQRECYVKMQNEITNFRTLERPEKVQETALSKKIKNDSFQKHYIPVKKTGSNRGKMQHKERGSRRKNKILYDEI